MNYLLALDQGTSSTRAMLYHRDGRLISTSQYPITQYYPAQGWVEHDPEELWLKTLQALRDVISQVNLHEIAACGITNQRETTLIWNKLTGQCLARAIVWQDRRTEDYCRTLSDSFSMIQQKTGLRCDPYFSATKLRWYLKNNQEAARLAAQGHLAFGTVDSYLIWRLTRGQHHLTDVTNASRTLLFNIHSLQWDVDLLRLFEIPESVLPEVQSCDGSYGSIHQEWLGAEIPITGVAGDQQAALIGQGCFHAGAIKATFGTGGFLLMNTGAKPVCSQHQLLSTIAYQVKDQIAYGLEGSIFHAGTTIKWLRDELKLIETADESEPLSASLASNEGVYLVSSFTGLGAPHWMNTSGAMMFGLSRSTTKAHFARAALEGVCYQTREVLDCMRSDSELSLSVMRVDGGMSANSWFLQFMADQCQLNMQRPKDIETTAKGAALLAGLGCGLYKSVSDLAQMNEVNAEFKPQRSLEEVERDYSGWQKILSHVNKP